MNSLYEQTNNWDLAILVAVLLLLFFIWFYKFLFVLQPNNLSNPLDLSMNFSDEKIL